MANFLKHTRKLYFINFDEEYYENVPDYDLNNGIYIAANNADVALAYFYKSEVFQEYVHKTRILPNCDAKFVEDSISKDYKGELNEQEVCELGYAW